MDIKRLEKWFEKRCNGDWEHQGGIKIETYDNPCWGITVYFDDSENSVDKLIVGKSVERSDTDFVKLSYDYSNNSLKISCGILNLSEAIGIFLDIDPE